MVHCPKAEIMQTNLFRPGHVLTFRFSMAGEKRTEVHTGDHRVPEEQQKYISGQGLHPSGRAPRELAYAEFILSKYVHAVVLSSHASIPLRTQAQPLT